jgi:hypothetical protein
MYLKPSPKRQAAHARKLEALRRGQWEKLSDG